MQLPSSAIGRKHNKETNLIKSPNKMRLKPGLEGSRSSLHMKSSKRNIKIEYIMHNFRRYYERENENVPTGSTRQENWCFNFMFRINSKWTKMIEKAFSSYSSRTKQSIKEVETWQTSIIHFILWKTTLVPWNFWHCGLRDKIKETKQKHHFLWHNPCC